MMERVSSAEEESQGQSLFSQRPQKHSGLPVIYESSIADVFAVYGQ